MWRSRALLDSMQERKILIPGFPGKISSSRRIHRHAGDFVSEVAVPEFSVADPPMVTLVKRCLPDASM
jgi:pyoverdine/dityrosine biosynthesis protein Dit1